MPSLHEQFQKFATKADHNEATSKDLSRWFQDAGVLGKTCTANNLDICFAKAKTRGKNTITFKELDTLLNHVAKSYMTDHKLSDEESAKDQLKAALIASEKQTHGTTGVSKTGGVERMTDVANYTGAHKQRFDADGKGKGLEGREDVHDNTGYVGGYKGANTYDK